ncbi:MAG: ABC transporter permease, partial [Candidatus Hydrogenedentes bacterium]|nr:ABC transporter permease [Candidatus Hydrogenedentota bacterium]
MRQRFALAARELTRSGRSPKTYALRVLVAGSAIGVIVVAWINVAPFSKPEVLAATLGEGMAGAALIFQFAVVLVIAPALSAGLIAEEKQHNTLTLLLLADINGADIFLAKFLAAFLQVEMLILSTLPLVASAAFFGGVSVPTAAYQVLLFSAAAMAVCAGSLLCSSLVESPRQALLLAVTAVGLWVALSLVIDGHMAYYSIPARTNLLVVVTSYASKASSRILWSNVFFHLAAALMAARLTIGLLPRRTIAPRRERHGRQRARYPWGKGAMNMGRLAQLFAANAGGRDFTADSRIVRMAAVGVFIAMAAVPVLGWIATALLLALHIAASMSAARRQGLLADMLVTPIAESSLVRAVFHANLNRTLIILPAMIVSEAVSISLVAHGIAGRMPWGTHPERLALIGFTLGPALFGVLRFVCAVAVSCSAGAGSGGSIWNAVRATVSIGAVSIGVYAPMLVAEAGQWAPQSVRALAWAALAWIAWGAGVYIAVAAISYRRLGLGLWGRLPVRGLRALGGGPRATQRE